MSSDESQIGKQVIVVSERNRVSINRWLVNYFKPLRQKMYNSHLKVVCRYSAQEFRSVVEWVLNMGLLSIVKWILLRKFRSPSGYRGFALSETSK